MPPKKSTPKKQTLWAKYQDLLVQKPFTMNLIQSGVIGGAGNVTAQLIMDGSVAAGPVAEQVLLNVCFIAPIVSQWFPILGKLGLGWIGSTCVDQFMFSPVFNIGVFYFIAAAFKGGITLAAGSSFAAIKYEEVCTTKLFRPTQCSPGSSVDSYELAGLALHPGSFAPLTTYSPIWSTQVSSYYVWLPACIVREKYVPAHLKQLFVTLIAFIWNVIFSFILASS